LNSVIQTTPRAAAATSTTTSAATANTATPQQISVGELVARFLSQCGVQAAFGVISIHNMPILDAFHRLGQVRFVPARGEQGATGMADAYARVSGGLGVVITSTGTAAGNTCGAMVEAQTAGTPLLHITGQVELPYLDRNLAYIHEARDQMSMMKSLCKSAWRIWDAQSALGVLRAAVRDAMSAPAGPVGLEIPIDVQEMLVDLPDDLSPLPLTGAQPDAAALDALAAALARARRPLLWLGGGARGASAAVQRLVALGIGVVSSTQGRGILREDHPLSLGAFNIHAPVEAFYASCDAMLVVGSKLRSNETFKYRLRLPQPLYRIDADPAQEGRNYASSQFVCGDAALALQGLAERLEQRRAAGGFVIDPAFAADLRQAHDAAVALVRKGLAPYAPLVDGLQQIAGSQPLWVRDVTVSNSTWGNRLLQLFGPRDGVHALGGGIGQGFQMGIGAAIAEQLRPDAKPRKVLCLSGDGGLMVNVGELATAVQEQADLLIVLMNDRGYGVIRNIQDAQYGGRRVYADLHTPDFAQLASALGLGYLRLDRIEDVSARLAEAAAQRGPLILEVDMNAIGPYQTVFAGPPVRKN